MLPAALSAVIQEPCERSFRLHTFLSWPGSAARALNSLKACLQHMNKNWTETKYSSRNEVRELRCERRIGICDALRTVTEHSFATASSIGLYRLPSIVVRRWRAWSVNASCNVQIPLGGPNQTLSETRVASPYLRHVRGLCLVESGPVRSGPRPCSGIWH